MLLVWFLFGSCLVLVWFLVGSYVVPIVLLCWSGLCLGCFLFWCLLSSCLLFSFSCLGLVWFLSVFLFGSC